MDLGYSVVEGEKLLSKAQALVPEKEREGKYGTSMWPLYIYELVKEYIVNGAPPSSINGNIIAHIRTFSPSTIIEDFPSIWTIWRTRTVLLIIVQTLAAYWLGKCPKWEQLFTDGTSRRQSSFADLAISIKEDEDDIYTPLLLSSSIYPEDESSETVMRALVDTIQEKGEMLQGWISMHQSIGVANLLFLVVPFYSFTLLPSRGSLVLV